MALTDREIWELGWKYVPEQKWLLNPFEPGGGTTTDDDDETTPGSGTGTGYITRGHEEEFEGGVPPGVLGSEALLSQFNLATRNRQKRLENPNKITRFFNNLTGGGQRPVSEMVTGNIGDFSRMPIDTKNFGLEVLEDEGQYGPLRTFETDTRRTAGIPMGIAKLFSMLPDPYYDKFTLPQQAYTQLNMGYSGPTVFGQHGSNLSNYDVFGRNVRHGGKRSYNETQQRDIDRLDDYWDSEKFADKYGGAKLEYDAASGSYMFKENGKLTSNAQKANKMNKANLTRYNYDKAGVLKFNTMNKAHEKNLINRKRWEKETRREQDTADDRFGEVIDGIPGGTGDYDEYSGIGGTWSGPVGPQPKDKEYADPSVDAEENQPSNDNIGYNEPTSGSDGEFGPGSWMIADGGMVKDAPRRFFNGGLASVLNRRSFQDGRSAAPDFLTGADRENWLAGYTALPLNEFLIDHFKAPDGGTTPPDGGTTPPDGGGGGGGGGNGGNGDGNGGNGDEPPVGGYPGSEEEWGDPNDPNNPIYSPPPIDYYDVDGNFIGEGPGTPPIGGYPGSEDEWGDLSDPDNPLYSPPPSIVGSEKEWGDLSDPNNPLYEPPIWEPPTVIENGFDRSLLNQGPNESEGGYVERIGKLETKKERAIGHGKTWAEYDKHLKEKYQQEMAAAEKAFEEKYGITKDEYIAEKEVGIEDEFAGINGDSESSDNDYGDDDWGNWGEYNRGGRVYLNLGGLASILTGDPTPREIEAYSKGIYENDPSGSGEFNWELSNNNYGGRSSVMDRIGSAYGGLARLL